MAPVAVADMADRDRNHDLCTVVMEKAKLVMTMGWGRTNFSQFFVAFIAGVSEEDRRE